MTAQYLTDKVVGVVLKDADEDTRERVRKALPNLAHHFFWSRFRSTWWRWTLGLLVAIGGLAGTVVLMQQNTLIKNQNALMENQNVLIQRQAAW